MEWARPNGNLVEKVATAFSKVGLVICHSGKKLREKGTRRRGSPGWWPSGPARNLLSCSRQLLRPEPHPLSPAIAEIPGTRGWPSVPGTLWQLPPRGRAEPAFLLQAGASSEAGAETSTLCFQKQPSGPSATCSQLRMGVSEVPQPPFPGQDNSAIVSMWFLRGTPVTLGFI